MVNVPVNISDCFSAVLSQWLGGDEEEDEDVAEEGGEDEVAQEDDHKATRIIEFNQPTVCTGLIFFLYFLFCSEEMIC